MPLRLSSLPPRVATGSYILHMGLEKFRGGQQQAEAIHKKASPASPFLSKTPSPTSRRTWAIGEMTAGGVLPLPLVPDVIAGAALTAFSSGLVTMYLRTPALHKPNSVWPTPAGIGVSKDIWM